MASRSHCDAAGVQNAGRVARRRAVALAPTRICIGRIGRIGPIRLQSVVTSGLWLVACGLSTGRSHPG